MSEYIQGITSSSDRELQSLLLSSMDNLGEQGLQQVILAHQRFNEPVHVTREDGRQVKDDNWSLKQLLKNVPAYMRTSQQVGIEADEAKDLLVHIMDSNPYEFTQVEREVMYLTNALGESQRKMERLSEEEITQLKNLITLGGENGVIPHSLYAYKLALRDGLSPIQAMKMVSKLPEADGSMAGYSFSPFNDALKTLSVAGADPDLIVKVFDLLGGDRPYFNQSLYAMFEMTITFGCPSNHIKPQDFMTSLVEAVDNGMGIEEFLENFSNDETPKLSIEPEIKIISPIEARNNYFVAKDGNLELAALPYRTRRTAQEGIEDLSQLARATSFRGEEVGEGFWVFDKDSNTWYSFGGMLQLSSGHVRHNMLPYDLSDLSNTPYMFHVHPHDLEVMTRFDARDSGLPQLARYETELTSFIAATPSRADFDVVAQLMEKSLSNVPTRSFIVHNLGITEFVYPNDIEVIKEMAVKFRDIRDRAILNHDWKNVFYKGNIVTDLITQLNKELPEGVKINFYPKGSKESDLNL